MCNCGDMYLLISIIHNNNQGIQQNVIKVKILIIQIVS